MFPGSGLPRPGEWQALGLIRHDLHEAAYPRRRQTRRCRISKRSIPQSQMKSPSSTRPPNGRWLVPQPFSTWKLFQRLGYFIRLTDVPTLIRQHIVAQTGFARPPRLDELLQFDRATGRERLIESMRRFLNVRPLNQEGPGLAATLAETGCRQSSCRGRHHQQRCWRNLVHHRYELPGIWFWIDWPSRPAKRFTRVHFARVSPISSIPKSKNGSTAYSRSARMNPAQPGTCSKREPKKPTNKNRSHLQHIRRLQILVEQLPQPDIPVPKLKQYRYIARSPECQRDGGTEIAEALCAGGHISARNLRRPRRCSRPVRPHASEPGQSGTPQVGGVPAGTSAAYGSPDRAMKGGITGLSDRRYRPSASGSHRLQRSPTSMTWWPFATNTWPMLAAIICRSSFNLTRPLRPTAQLHRNHQSARAAARDDTLIRMMRGLTGTTQYAARGRADFPARTGCRTRSSMAACCFGASWL